MKVQNKDLTFHQLMNSLVSTIFTDMPADEMSLELSNKQFFIQFLIEMSFVDVLWTSTLRPSCTGRTARSSGPSPGRTLMKA